MNFFEVISSPWALELIMGLPNIFVVSFPFQSSLLIHGDCNTPIYNLRGQRLEAPQKGINIIGGKKVVVK